MAFALGTTSGAGTITIAAGSTVVTGVGTNFQAANVGAILVVGSQWGVIASRASTTSVTLDRAFATAVTGSAYTISANIPVITQTGTDTSLTNLTGIPGVTTSPSISGTIWTITSASLVVTGALTINRLFNRLRFLNSNSLLTASTTQSVFSISGTFNNSIAQTTGGYSFHSPNYSILFEGAPTGSSSVGNLIGTTAASISVFEGNIEFNLAVGTSPLTFILEGNTTVQYGAFINASVTGQNVQFTTQLDASTLTINNWAGYGCGLRVLGNTTNINNYISVGAAGAVNNASGNAVNNPIYVGLQDFGNAPAFRTVNNSLKYFQLLNFVSNKSSAALATNNIGTSSLNSQILLTNSLVVTAQDSVGVVQDMKLWAKDSNNGSRCSANYGAGLGFEIATTGDLTYTGTTSASGTFTFPSIISAIFWQPTNGTSSTLTTDWRGNGGATSQNLVFYSCSYKHNLAQQTPDLYAFNSTTGLYNTIAAKNAIYLLLTDTAITQTTMATVAAYTTLDTAQQFYDYAKYYLWTNFVGQTATYVTRAINTINAGSYNVIIDATAVTPFVFAGSTITAKSSTFTGSLTTSGAVTLANGAVFSNNTVTANVAQATPTNLTDVTINGNLTYNTNSPITVTFTNCAISGTISNSGTGAVTISTNNSTIGTTGTNVTKRIVSSLTINGLTAGSQIYIANGAGTQVAYVASSGTSYTVDTTGFTGTWSWKVTNYGYTAQTGTHSPAVASTTVTVTLVADAFITQPTKATVAAYTVLGNLDRLYDYAAYYETTNSGIIYSRVVTKAGTAASIGSYNATLNSTGSVWTFNGSALSINIAGSLAAGTTITGALFTSGVVTLSGAIANTALTANVLQLTPTNLTSVTIVGNLTYNTNTITTVTFNSASISGTLSNSGTAIVTISANNSNIATVGTRITTRPVTAITLNNLTAGSQIYITNGAGTQVAYVASSDTSYTLDTTGQTGTWSWKVARYGFTAQTGTHSPAVASTTVTVTLVADAFITQATKATVAAYTVLDNNDKLYDYSAYYETTNAGIAYARVITKAGTSPSAGSYPVTINDTADLFVFDGSSLSIWTNYTLSPGTTITGPLFTSDVVTIPTGFNNASITANVSQLVPSDMSDVTITGNLTYNESAPFLFSLTMTNCVITGTVSNSGTADVLITKVNTTLGTLGARVTAQQFATISAPNLLSGSRVRIYNVTNLVEIYNDVLTSAGFSQAFIFTGNKTVKLTATYQNGTNAKLAVEATGVLTAGGLQFLNLQEDDAIYNGYAIDGSTVTKFEADYANDQIDLKIGTNFFVSELYAWWVYNLTTPDGIRDFVGGITAEDASNLRINANFVSIKLDNITPTIVRQLDNIRIYRSDSAYPVADPTSGGGGMDVNWQEKVYIATLDSNGIAAILRNTNLIPGLF